MKLAEIVPNSCRVCLKRNSKLRSLYKPVDEGEEPPNEMLRLIAGIELEKADIYETLPKFICKSCELSLSLAFQFREKVLHTHKVIENYRVREWCTEEDELQCNNSIRTYVKEETNELANENNFLDETTINEDNLQNGVELKDEMIQLSISQIDTLDMGFNEICNEQQDIADSNGYDDMDEECKPEYLYDDEFYNADVSEQPQTLIDDGHSSPKDIDSLNYEDEVLCSNDSIKEMCIEEPVPNQLVKETHSIDKSQIRKRLRKNIHKNGTPAKLKSSKIEYPNDLEESIPDIVHPEEKVESPPMLENKAYRSNGDKAHICDICGNIYAKRGRMMEHRRRHDKEQRFACELCDKRFHLRETLRKHMFLHTGGKPFKCSFCSRTFFYESVKKAHEVIHSGIKPYVCDECNKAFAYAHALSKHKLIHADIKLYHCKYCDKDFRLQHHMKQHVETKLHQNAVYAAQLKLNLCKEQPSDVTAQSTTSNTLSDRDKP